MNKPVVVVIENPEEDPDIFVSGDVEIIELSTYPMSKWCPPEEVADYGTEYLEAIVAARDQFPSGSPAWEALDHMRGSFAERLAEANEPSGGEQ